MVAPDTLRTIRAVGLDVDGTLSQADHTIPPRTTTAIQAVSRLGIPTILLTGRARPNVRELAERFEITNPVASNNGAVTFDPVTDADIAIRPMSHTEVREVLSLAAELDLESTWWTTEEIYVDRDGNCAQLLRELNESGLIVSDADNLPPVVTKVMLYGTEAELDAVADTVVARFPQAARSMDEFFEFVAPDANKWHALSDILGQLDIDPAHCLGIGDGGNDIPWLSRIGVPVAMGNARAEVKAVATSVTESNANEGVAVVLENLATALEKTTVHD